MSQISLLAGLGPAPDPPSGASDEFYTPRREFEPWHREFGFTLDPCATAESAKVARYFDYLKDGLTQSWAGERVFCNPPYSDITPWVRKAWAEVLAECELVAMLLPAWTDRKWWQEEIEPFRDDALRSRRGNVSLLHPRAAIHLGTRFLPRIRFGFPGDPEGATPKAKEFGAKIYPVLLVWESAGEQRRRYQRTLERDRAGRIVRPAVGVGLQTSAPGGDR